MFPDQSSFSGKELHGEEDSVSGEVHGNFVASLLTQAGVRAPNRDRSSLAATWMQRGRFSPRCSTGRNALRLETQMEFLVRAFDKIGARVKFGEAVPRWVGGRRIWQNLELDVRDDAKGEFFLIARNTHALPELVVLDVQPREKHLLLLSREGGEKHRFLLGHDERHWFVAGIPELSPVSRVRDALVALKPETVVVSEGNVRRKVRDRRRNAARVRQGEWFFVPAAGVPISPLLILRSEPLVRSRGGKSHTCEQLYRFGGETVYVSPGAPNGLTEADY